MDTPAIEQYVSGAQTVIERSGSTDRAVVRNTVRETWRWMWKDTADRVVPFILTSALYSRATGTGLERLGMRRVNLPHELAIGVVAGVPMAAVAIWFRGRIAPRYALPTPSDQVLQSAFYLVVNAPVEELLWRAVAQTAAIDLLGRVPRLAPVAPAAGWGATTLAFGLYHRLGNWNWKAVAGVTAAGALFGALYEFRRPRRSLVVPTIVHGFATAGFLSWGDAALHARHMAESRKRSK